MPYSATSAAAVQSWVDSGLEAARWTSAPPAARVRIRFAVSVVTWRQAPIRRPASGRSRSNRSRIRRRTGISRSAHSMRRTPSSASERSVTSCGTAGGVGHEVSSAGGVGLRWCRRLDWCGAMGWACWSTGGTTGVAAATREQAAERRREARPGRRGAPGEPLLEAAVLLVAEVTVGGDRGRVVGPHVEHDVVAGAEQLGGHGARHRLRVAAPAVIGVRQDVADDREARPRG